MGTQQAASQRFVYPVIRSSVSHWHLRHQFLLCPAFSGIQRVGADCLPEVSSLKMLQPRCPYLWHSSGTSQLQGLPNGPLPPPLEHLMLHFSPEKVTVWKQVSQMKKCWDHFPALWFEVHLFTLSLASPANHMLCLETYFWGCCNCITDQNSNFQSTNTFSTSGP